MVLFLASCPLAVLAAVLVRLLAMIWSVNDQCVVIGTKCQENAPFTFMPLREYALLRDGLLRFHPIRPGTQDIQEIAGEWPIAALERHVWTGYARMWRTFWPDGPARVDYCKCAVNYDYWTTLIARHDADTHMLQSEATQQAEARMRSGVNHKGLRHCNLYRDPVITFELYASALTCLPGAILEHIDCVESHAIQHHLGSAVRFADSAMRMSTLGAQCLDEVVWPFSRTGVLQVYAASVWVWATGTF